MLATSYKEHPFKWSSIYARHAWHSTQVHSLVPNVWKVFFLPVDIMFGTSKPESQLLNGYVVTLKKQVTSAFDMACKQMGRQHVHQK